MSEERTTAELIITLGDDIDRCHGELLAEIDASDRDPNGDVAVDGYRARQLIRAIFAYIEAVTFSVKVNAVKYSREHGQNISRMEELFAVDTEYVLTDKGKIVERPAHIRLADNIRFAFALQEKARGIKKGFDPSVEWWSCLKASIKVRDRLTHPKFPEDIDLSGAEIIDALKAYKGFSDYIMTYVEQRDT